MKKQDENQWTFWHDGRHWIAANALVSFYAPELEDLDKQIIGWCRQNRISNPVHLYYDNSRIPAWMRPYMNHYMNRKLKI